METLPSSVRRVRCVAKRTVQRASKYDFSGDSVRVSETENVALCSLCDGDKIYLITLKEDQISKLQEGETYIINNATVKEDHPVSEMILGNEAGVFRTAPLQLDEKLIHRAKESINPSSRRAGLNDPGLYLKKGYITLTGKVVSLGAPRQTEGDIPVRDVVIGEARVKVTVSLQKEAATKPLQPGQMIKITYIKVEKIQAHEKKLMSSDYTVVSILTDEPEEESLIKVVGFSTEDDELVLLTEDQEELSVAHRLSSEDADQLQRKLPVKLKITRRHKEVIKFLTAPPSLDGNLIHRMNKSISRSSDRAVLNDPVPVVSAQPQSTDEPEGSTGNNEESDTSEETSFLPEKPSPSPSTSGMEMQNVKGTADPVSNQKRPRGYTSGNT
ncbi:uncharacterized protein LOC118820300 isoform X2 [Colossoma macropomum]|nr:uncharacterized protein LOC118820300 isoform X2 [Colossoma macropomum]